MTKVQISAMSDVEVRLRLENVRLRVKIVSLLLRNLEMRSCSCYYEFGFYKEEVHTARHSELIARKNRLRTQEKKWRLELDRRERR